MQEHEKQELLDQIKQHGRVEMRQRLKRGDFNSIQSHRAFVEVTLDEMDRSEQKKAATEAANVAWAALMLAVIAILISLFLPNGVFSFWGI